jgi:signal recognition particle receptor subunit alpha
MIDYAAVISAGGLILFDQSFEEQDQQAQTRLEVNEFIQRVFLSQKIQSEKRLKLNQHIFQYAFDQEKNLIYLIVFLENYDNPHYDMFLDQFMKLFETKYLKRKQSPQELVSILLHKKRIAEDFVNLLSSDFASQDSGNQVNPNEKDISKSNVSKTESSTKGKEKNRKGSESIKKPEDKTGRTWDVALGSSKNNSKNRQLENNLNFSKKESQEDIDQLNKDKYGNSDISGKEDSFEYISSDEEGQEEKEDHSIFSKFKSSLKKIAEMKNLNEATLKPILDSFKDDLIRKNVAEEIARKICENLLEKLTHTKAELLTTTKKLVKNALKDCLTSILTPKNNIDILAMALKRKEEGRPFVITFIGVNGVGKSTNLAKVAYLFKSNGFSVLLAACDNFRAGAVEQLKTHGRCLEVPVFDRGYKDDPANIARDAITEAAAKKIDVVLIDTAGRMQDNEPLMKALARLVNLNNPDVVLFIGEALVGNDGIDQLTKFNLSLKEMSANLNKVQSETANMTDKRSGMNGREIDGVILSKFDTVDDKVGAALSLTYSTGKPIIYIGVGQKYPNLKKLNIESVVRSLLA